MRVSLSRMRYAVGESRLDIIEHGPARWLGSQHASGAQQQQQEAKQAESQLGTTQRQHNVNIPLILRWVVIIDAAPCYVRHAESGSAARQDRLFRTDTL